MSKMHYFSDKFS